MKGLMRFALRLYPATWRHRYGAEMWQLIEDGHATPADLADLVSHAPLAATLRGEASAMTRLLSAHPTRLAIVALVIVLPTAVLVGLAVLKFIVGVPGPFDAVEPAVTPLVTHPLGETMVVLAPYIALALAVLPFARFRLGVRDSRLAASAEAAVPVPNLLVGALGAVLIVVMALYWVAENL